MAVSHALDSFDVPDHYLYLDETGTLDFEARPGECFFGVGTAHFDGDHGAAIWEGHQLRTTLEAKGIRLPKGLHAKNDSAATRVEMYQLIAQQAPRFDATMLRKANAYPYVQAAGKVRLYKLAVFMHLKYVVPAISSPGDRVFVIVGNLQTTKHRDAIRDAVHDICAQVRGPRIVVPCIWEAPSSWGIQVVDYLLWRQQRQSEGKTVPTYTDQVAPLRHSARHVWGS